MYEYTRKSKLGLGSILLIILFIFTIIGLAILFFLNKGKFWDFLPIASIAAIIISLIFAIFNMAKRAEGGFIFILFFIIFLAGLVMSSILGPFALSRNAQKAIDSGDYNTAIDNYNEIISNYPTSRYYDDSLKEITSAYQKTDDYENTIKYINLAVEQNILDMGNLEVKNALGESYAKIAEKAYEEKNYEKSAVNFVLAINIFNEITSEFPSSDETFILSYKIPDYLYKAANSHANTGSYLQSIDLLNEIIEKYPDSDNISKAKNLLFDSYIKEIHSLIEDAKYKEALDEYLLAKSIASENNIAVSINIYDENIYSKIPSGVLSEYAISLTLDKKYEDALHIFDYIFLNYSDTSEKITRYYSVCKIEIIKNTSFLPIPDIVYRFNIRDEVNFQLDISNNTDSVINIYFLGDTGKRYQINPKTKAEIVIAADLYEMAVEYSDNVEIKHYGEFIFETGKRYSQIFNIIVEEND
ncbi:MAG: tetratricopeptide repeat protein [Actinomycetota bacterium]|nr:tetratricopeptide repeat protein [Actinomycetota bacterium]